MAPVAETALKGVAKRVFARVEVMLDGGAKDVVNLGTDTVTKSAVASHALVNRAAELQREVATLSAKVDGLQTKLGAVKDVMRKSADTSWWTETWNNTVRHQNSDTQYNFLFRRWNNDESVLGALRNVLSRDVEHRAIPSAIPVLEEGDVHISQEAAKRLVGGIRQLQTDYAELTTQHAKLSTKLGAAKDIAEKWNQNNNWFSEEWNNTARHRSWDYKYTRFREIWDAADGYRNSLKAALGM